MGPGFGQEGRLRWFAHPFRGTLCGGHAPSPLSFPAPWEWQWGVLVFLCVFLPMIPPPAHAGSYFSSRTIPLYFVAGGDAGGGPAAKAPGPSPSGCGSRLRAFPDPQHARPKEQQYPTGPQPQALCRTPCHPRPPRLDWPERPSSWLPSELSATWNKWKQRDLEKGMSGLLSGQHARLSGCFWCGYTQLWASQVALVVKNPPGLY